MTAIAVLMLLLMGGAQAMPERDHTGVGMGH